MMATQWGSVKGGRDAKYVVQVTQIGSLFKMGQTVTHADIADAGYDFTRLVDTGALQRLAKPRVECYCFDQWRFVNREKAINLITQRYYERKVPGALHDAVENGLKVAVVGQDSHSPLYFIEQNYEGDGFLVCATEHIRWLCNTLQERKTLSLRRVQMVLEFESVIRRNDYLIASGSFDRALFVAEAEREYCQSKLVVPPEEPEVRQFYWWAITEINTTIALCRKLGEECIS